jgi:hypothetical protein
MGNQTVTDQKSINGVDAVTFKKKIFKKGKSREEIFTLLTG